MRGKAYSDSSKAASLYKLICLGVVIKEFADDIITHRKQYDFNTMVSRETTKYKSFQDHIQYFQNLNSVRGNSILSSDGIRISR